MKEEVYILLAYSRGYKIEVSSTTDKRASMEGVRVEGEKGDVAQGVYVRLGGPVHR